MELTDYRDKPTDELRAELMEDLIKSALYAIRSNSGAMVHECYGMMIGRGAVLELIAALLFWPLVAAAAMVIAFACGAAWIKERTGKWWRK